MHDTDSLHNAIDTMNVAVNTGAIDETLWMMGALACLLIHVVSFYWACWRQGVMGAFGRHAIIWKSLGFMTLTGCIPMLMFLPWMLLAHPLIGIPPAMEVSVIAVVWGYIGHELIGFIAKRIDASKAALEAEKLASADSKA